MSQQQLKSIVLRRLQANENQIKHSLACIAHGNPLASEPSEQRLQKRIIRKTNLTPAEARQVTQDIKAKAEAAPPLPAVAALPRRPEAIWGDTIDFVGVAFLERGVAAARTVARVAFHSGQGQGTGFLISNRLFLTNNHVIQTAAQVAQFRVEFDYERDLAGQQRTVSSFSLDPQAFFLTDSIDGLDFTIVAIGNQISGPAKIETFGWSGLSSAPDKHALGEAANIVQHPDGRFKEVVLRENRLVSRLDMALHYVADTEPGSSGSPVFNNDWEVIALHHWGGPWRELPTGDDEHSYEINEGIRISAIVKHLKQIYPSLTADRQVLLSVVLEREDRGPVVATSVTPEQPIDTGARLDGDGRVTWRVPLEVSVRLPMLDARPPLPPPPALPIADDIASSIIGPSDGEATRPSTNYSRRSGFVTDFISGLTVPLPKLSQAQRQIAARNQEAEDGDDPFELKYHHFSIVMNARRRLAFFGACNIDGSVAKHVDRKTGDVTVLQPDDDRLESLAAEAAEASDSWYVDQRIEPEEFAGKDVYETQRVPGFPNPSSRARILRMFQRGHVVRRMDPAWGSKQMAKLADADTFHWTNCSPQVGFFNMGQAPASTPNSGGGKLWRAAENYVLRNAVADQARICCITGPVFRQNDRRYRTIRVPGQFWKVIVWAEQGQMRSLALLLDQRPVIEVWPEALGLEEVVLGAEAFADSDELENVEDFLSTVDQIEGLTDLDFGTRVRNADIRGGESLRRIERLEEIPTSSPDANPRPRRRPARQQQRPARRRRQR